MGGEGRGSAEGEGECWRSQSEVPYCRSFIPQPLNEVQKPYRYRGYTPPPSPSANQSSPFIYSALQHTKEKTRAKGRGGAGAGRMGTKPCQLCQFPPFPQRRGCQRLPLKSLLR